MKLKLLFFTYLNDYESMRDLIDFFTEETYKAIDLNKNDKWLNDVSLKCILIIVLTILLTILFSFTWSRY